MSVNSKTAGKQPVEMFYNNSLQQYKQHSQQNNIESIQQPLSSHPANILVSVWPKGIQSTQATEQTTGPFSTKQPRKLNFGMQAYFSTQLDEKKKEIEPPQ